MTTTCPKCRTSQQFDENELYKHLQNVHRLTGTEIRRLVPSLGGSGWRETQQNTPSGRLAPEHQAAALRAQMQRDPPMAVPMVMAPTPKVEIKMPVGWTQGADGSYNFEKTTFEKHTQDNIITKIARGKLTQNRGVLSVFTYDKDTSELSRKQDELGLSLADMKNYTISDPEYVNLVGRAHNLDFEVKRLKKDLKAEVDSELIIEEYFRGEQGSEEHTKWKEEFMRKCMVEVTRLQTNSNRDEG